MKKVINISTLFGLFLLLSGCGKDGSEGLAFINYLYSDDIDYGLEIVNFSTTDPNYISISDSWDTFAQQDSTGKILNLAIDPSTYNYTLKFYDFWEEDTFDLDGNYEISTSQGDPGFGISDGMDGQDRYYQFYIGLKVVFDTVMVNDTTIDYIDTSEVRFVDFQLLYEGFLGEE
ncbi:MAG: hypothetical protein HN657_04275 [Candidatus Marinimicrobia bacterium]|jgi:hypothetical protein|nr:hypothetical protein [Candidatus Neomarinimicrobiota bacterium]MBT3495815.1 hypothetical protein [Candidatus Neomarinimicrobiota bacterium]MBT3692205.1 hypothetical protein [Candidatus Neomarinimicrobiota bacterium]MBT3732485.1 hypothetical protein [Candidatus Neomarinimicrobiota bacterium]MBT4144256.1 hypothetical protein [Candidatus Neomarinimicrobiota bacterium]